MTHLRCCVNNCDNTSRRIKLKFYKFSKIGLVQRQMWISAVRKINTQGRLWFPKESDRICSEHFIGNRKSENQLSPNYVPTIFPYKNASEINRRICLVKQKEIKQDDSSVNQNQQTDSPVLFCSMVKVENDSDEINKVDQECQVDFVSEWHGVPRSKTFVCDTYLYNHNRYSDVAIQTEIILHNKENHVTNIKCEPKIEISDVELLDTDSKNTFEFVPVKNLL